MNKQESQIMKGVAILLMIFLHLFNQSENVALCHNLIYIDGTALVHILSRAANPVAFFLFLGGYGLYKVYEKGDKHRWTRILKLYIHYWIILLIFILIGHFIKPEVYPGTMLTFLSNITGYATTYNGEMWFLLPYTLLSVLSPYLFKIMEKFRVLTVIVVTLLIHLCTSFCISRYGYSFLYHNLWAYKPLLVFHLLFNFSLGAMMARCRFFEHLKSISSKHRSITAICAWGG